MVANQMRHVLFEHYRSGLQPSGLMAALTQAFGLGWDMAAPLALSKTVGATQNSRQ